MTTTWYLEMWEQPKKIDTQRENQDHHPEYESNDLDKSDAVNRDVIQIPHNQEVAEQHPDKINAGIFSLDKSVYRYEDCPLCDQLLPENFALVKWIKPTVDEYLQIYRSVGGKYNWYDRLLMDRAKVEAILGSADTEVLLLIFKRNGEEVSIAGFSELSNKVLGETEIVYFGLCDDFTGRKAGMPFLQSVIQYAWNRTRKINRLWLHTCDLDHQAALPMYKKAGFLEYDRQTVLQYVK